MYKYEFKNTVTSGVTRVSLIRIGCNDFDRKLEAVCITWASSYACWLFSDFVEHSKDMYKKNQRDAVWQYVYL